VKVGTVRALWIVYFLCLVPALVTLVHRSQFDRGFNSVALVADYAQLLELAQTENVPIEDVLVRVRDEAGVKGLAVLEDTPEFLALRGKCTIVEGVGWPGWNTPEEREEIEKNEGREPEEAAAPETNWPLMMGLRHDMTHLIFTNEADFRRVAAVAQERYGDLVEIPDTNGNGWVLGLAGEPKIVLEWGLGFDEDLVGQLKDMGFDLYPRLRDYPGYPPGTVDAVLTDTARVFPDGLIIFDGDSILGGNVLVPITSVAVRRLGLKAGWVEFAEQAGGSSLADRLPDRTARVHSIEDEEMEIVTPPRAVARYVRAVRERAVRIVYLKPFLLAVDRANRVDKSIEMFRDVREALESKDFRIGKPSTVAEGVASSVFSRVAAILVFGTGLALLLHTLKIRVSMIGLAAILVAAFVVGFVPGWLGQKIVALGIAVVSPTLAISWLVERYDGAWIEIRKLRITSLWPAIGHWVGAVAITATGALMIAASLISTSTLLEIDAFSGVKIALYLPILLSILIGVQLIIPSENRTLAGALSWLLNVPVRIWHVLLGLAGLVALFVMIDRSGNFPIISVAGWENDVRGWFETMLYARPRTKEMLVGHPALMLGLYLGLSNIGFRRALMYAGVVIGSIALTSMTNTFCHIHTAIILSIYRTLAGAVIGGVIGIVLGAIILGLVRGGRRHVT